MRSFLKNLRFLRSVFFFSNLTKRVFFRYVFAQFVVLKKALGFMHIASCVFLNFLNYSFGKMILKFLFILISNFFFISFLSFSFLLFLSSFHFLSFACQCFLRLAAIENNGEFFGLTFTDLYFFFTGDFIQVLRVFSTFLLKPFLFLSFYRANYV